MPFPQSTTWGHLGIRNSAQFAAMNPAQFAGQGIYVDNDNGVGLSSYYSDGVRWVLNNFSVADAVRASLAPAPFRALPREAAPTMTVSGTQLAGSQQIFGITSDVLTDKIGFYGVARQNLARRANVVTQDRYACAARASADTSSSMPFWSSFYITNNGPSFDIVGYNDSFGGPTIFIDGQLFAVVSPRLSNGTAQAGAAATITLAAGSSAVDGFYNQAYVRTTGGTGPGQLKRIIGYVGATKIATVESNWGVVPDGTTTYEIDSTTAGLNFSEGGATLKYFNIVWPVQTPTIPMEHRIDVYGYGFFAVDFAQTDAVRPAPPMSQMPLLVVGDSFWAGSAGPQAFPNLISTVGLLTGLLSYNLSSGGTGVVSRGASRLNFLNRIAPPDEAWEFFPPAALGASSGTFTVSITYAGLTATTGTVAFNASAATLETALNLLVWGNTTAASGSSVTTASQGKFCVARGDINSRYIVVANGLPGATISIDGSALIGSAAPTVTQYLGDVAKNLPTANGVPQPFVLLVPGSGNDTTETDAKVQANFALIATAINTKFPTAVPVFTGVLGDCTIGASGVIDATMLSRNAAISAAAARLPKIGGSVPFIDTYSEGLGGKTWISGAGSVGAPTNGETDIMKSLIVLGHPTGLGSQFLAARFANAFLQLLRGNSF